MFLKIISLFFLSLFLLWRDVNRTFFDNGQADYVLSIANSFALTFEARFAQGKSLTSDVDAIGPTTILSKLSAQDIASFSRAWPRQEVTVVTVPTKPCYLSFPASLVNLRMENRSEEFSTSRAQSVSKKFYLHIFRYFLTYRKCSAGLSFEEIIK